MSMFGGNNKSRDIRDIVSALTTGTSTICNESVANSEISSIEIENMAEQIKALHESHYSDMISDQFDTLLKEDAESTAQLFKNNLVDMSESTAMTESATLPSLTTLTASIATTMRTPYEAVLHRLFDTRTLDKQTVEIEEVVPTVKAPSDSVEQDLIDALAPNAATKFIDKTEINVTALTNGVVPGVQNVSLFTSSDNPLFRVNRDVRITKIDVTFPEVPAVGNSGDPDYVPKVDAETPAASAISIAKGSVPYFDAKTNTLECIFNVKRGNGTVVQMTINAKIDFNRSVLTYLRADSTVTKVYFAATVSHAEHTHPIYTSFKNNFEQFCVPTRPHIEVSLPQEMRTDIQNSIQHFANTDVVTAMTENISVISSRMEDQRLKKCLDQGHVFEGKFSFDAPSNFAYGNLEWLKREFIPFLDQIAMKMKNEYNISDCHFRVAVSPYILRIIDTDYTMDKAMTEDSKGTGAINYSIGCKTSTSTFYFISSQFMTDNMLQVLLIPNNFKNSQVKTYNYFKYSSFLTDQLRRSDNHAMPAIVYSERNLPVVFTDLSAMVEITEMPIMKTSGDRYIKRV